VQTIPKTPRMRPRRSIQLGSGFHRRVAIKRAHASGAVTTRSTWATTSITCPASPERGSRAKGMVARTMTTGAAQATKPGWQISERNAGRGRLSRTIRNGIPDTQGFTVSTWGSRHPHFIGRLKMGQLQHTAIVKRWMAGGSIGASLVACTHGGPIDGCLAIPSQPKGGCLATPYPSIRKQHQSAQDSASPNEYA
jgi:hypothetical protein